MTRASEAGSSPRPGRGVAGSAGVYLATSIANAVLTFIVWPIYTRYMSPEQFGPIAMLLSLGMLWSSLVDTGVQYPIIQQEREGKAEPAFRFATIYISIAVLALFALFAPVCHVLVRHFMDEARLLSPTTVAMLFGGIGVGMYSSAGRGYLRAKRRSGLYSAVTLLPTLAGAAVGLTVLFRSESGIHAVASGTLARGIAQACLGGAVWAKVRMPAETPSYDWRGFMAISLPYTPHATFSQLTWNIPRWSLGLLGLSADVAFFSMTTTLLRPVNMCFSALNKAWSPEAIKVESQDRALALRRHAELFSTVASIVALFGICLPGELFELVLGEGWSGAQNYLSYLVVATIGFGFYMFPAAVFLAEKKTRFAPRVSGAALIVTAVTCVPLTLLFGAPGAGWSMMIGSVSYIAISLYLAARECGEDAKAYGTIPTATIIRSVATLVTVAAVNLIHREAAWVLATAGAIFLLLCTFGRGRGKIVSETPRRVLVEQ